MPLNGWHPVFRCLCAAGKVGSSSTSDCCKKNAGISNVDSPSAAALKHVGREEVQVLLCVYVCVFVSFILDAYTFQNVWAYQPGTQRSKVNTDVCFFYSSHVPSVVLSLIFIATRFRPFLSLVDNCIKVLFLTEYSHFPPLCIF